LLYINYRRKIFCYSYYINKMTTTETNNAGLYTSPLVLGFGNDPVNSSFPIGAKQLQTVYPSSGTVSGSSPWAPNTVLQFRQMMDKNAGMSLHSSYIQMTFTVGRRTEWASAANTAPPPAQGGGAVTENSIRPLDAVDRLALYSHWNPQRLIQQANVFVGSTNLESVTNNPRISDFKYSSYSQEACRSTLSDCFCQPPDGTYSANGTPMFHRFTAGTLNYTVDAWLDSSISTYGPYTVGSGQDDVGTAPLPPNGLAPMKAQDQLYVCPLEYFVRNGQYAVPVCTRYTATAINNIPWYTAPAGNEYSGATVPTALLWSGPAALNVNVNGQVSFHTYYANNGTFDTWADNISNGYGGVGIANPYPGANPACQLTQAWVTKRIPLSMLFGSFEQNNLWPSNLLQINLTRALDQEFITNMLNVQPSTGGNQGIANQRSYGVCVADVRLILKYFNLNQQSADLLSRDQLLLLSHYSLVENNLSSTATGSASLQAYSGLRSVCIRMYPNYAVCGQSTAVTQEGSISIIYRGKQDPLQIIPWRVQMNPPAVAAASANHTWPGGPMIRADPSLYYEMYSSYLGNSWYGVSATCAPSVGFDVGTWFKSQFTVTFEITQDQSQNIDSVSAPVTVNYSLPTGSQAQYDPSPLYADGFFAEGILSNADVKFDMSILFVRTNLVRYVGKSRQLIFITNGAS
jgi:hypothetical protein